MSHRLSDGTIVPSYLQAKSTLRPQPSGQFGNVPFRIGEVKEIIFPDDPRSLSGKVVEYRVAVQHKDSGVGSSVDYTNCVVMNLFGGLGDKLRYTVRASTEKDTNPDTGLGNGSIVLLLCINGETNRAVIVGGFISPDETENESESDGHNLHFNFNGIDATINKDGEFTLTYEGATDNLGDPASGVDTKSVNSQVTFTKDGSIYLGDGTGKQSIKIDHQKQQIIVLDQKGVLVGAATDAWVLGTTYRNAEHSSNQSVMQQLNLAMQQLTLASSMLTTAGGLLGIPVVGPMMAAQPVTTAAQAVNAAGQALKAAASAIQGFESGAASYLSKKNLTD